MYIADIIVFHAYAVQICDNAESERKDWKERHFSPDKKKTFVLEKQDILIFWLLCKLKYLFIFFIFRLDSWKEIVVIPCIHLRSAWVKAYLFFQVSYDLFIFLFLLFFSAGILWSAKSLRSGND